MSRHFIASILFLFVAIGAQSAEVYVPEELEGWREWVLHDRPYIDCPWFANVKERAGCVWLSSVEISVTRGESRGGATFVIVADVFGKTNVRMPHAEGYLPQEVTVNGTTMPLVSTPGGPALPLKSDRYRIEGKLSWPIVLEPAFLEVPESAFLHLEIDGATAQNVRLDDGMLWLRSRRQEDSADTLNIKVFRYLEDGIPLMLTTELRLTAEGQNRTFDLGKVLPDSFVVTSIDSTTPFRIDDDGTASVQLTRGTSYIEFSARSVENVEVFDYHKANEHWPEVEYWGWSPKRDIRLVRVEGPPSLDLGQIDYPFQVSDSAGFVLSEDVSMRLIEEQRGNLNPYPARFDVEREMWLSFDGNSFIVRDEIQSDTDSETAIVVNYVPGKIEVNSDPRLVTYSDPDNLIDPGVNLSDRTSEIHAVSLLDNANPIHAVGWKIDADSLKATLNVPPGWRLLWSRGVDRVTDSWLSSWSIWDIFLAALLIGLVFRVGGPIWAGVVAIAVVISYQEHAVTTIGFLVLAAIAALVRIIDHEGLRRFLLGVHWVLVVPIAIACIFYSTYAARQAIYPQLERQAFPTYDEQYAISDERVANRLRSKMEEGSAISRSDFKEKEVVVMMAAGAFVPRPEWEIQFTGVQIPTGPGIPTWDWREIALDWSGPVSQEQTISLTFLPPWLFRILSLASAALTMLVLLFFVLRNVPPAAKIPPLLRALVPGLGLLLFVPYDASAEVPQRYVLDELERRLLAPPSCVPECFYYESALVDIEPDKLQTEMIVHVAAEVAVPVPESIGTWTHDRVSVNDSNVPLARVEGRMFVLLGEGVHTVRTRASIGDFSRIDISYQKVPGFLRYDIEGWRRQGVDDSARSTTHTFIRIDDTDSEDTITLLQDPVEPYVRVTRVLRFVFDPIVETIVTRVTPKSGPFSVVIPLLEGETMIGDFFSVENRKVTVAFPTDGDRAVWRTRLDPTGDITLTAPPIGTRQEIWRLAGSDFWHYDYAGLMPVKSANRGTTFYPRSDETLQVSLTRPKPVGGDWITVQEADLAVEVGNRSTNAELSLMIEASQADEFDLQLPEGARVTSIRSKGDDIPVPATGEVKLPLSAGSNAVSVSWLMDEGASWLFKTPRVQLQQHARNIDIHVAFPESRWTLLLGGPLRGAAVLFWGIAIVVLVLAVALSRLDEFPISTPAAVLLTLGASVANLWALLFAGAWFIAIWWRNRNDFGGVESPYYAFGQLVFLLVSALAVGVLVATVPVALLGQPDMLIAGYGSNALNYFWYADYSTITLPTAWVVSLPHWVYLMTMFAWSFWLAIAIVNWVRLAWQAVSRPQFWPPRKPRKKSEANEISESGSMESQAKPT